MQTFERRPLAVFCFVFICTSLLAFTLAGLVKIIILSVLTITAVFILLLYIISIKKLSKLMYLFLCLILALLAIFQSYLYFDNYLLKNQYDGEKHTVVGTVQKRESNADIYTTYTIKLKYLDGKKNTSKMLLECEYVCALAENEIFTAEIGCYSLNNGYDIIYNANSMISDGYVLYGISGSEADYTVIGKAPENIKTYFRNVNDLYSSKLKIGIKGEAGALASALLLGNKSDLSNGVNGNFRKVGVSHILSLSGMHMSIVIGAFELLLRKLRVNKNIRCGVVALGALSYLALTGFYISAVRSVFMILSVYLCYYFATEGDSITALFIIISTIILITPYAICDIGMWLSFLATFGILLTAPYISAFCGGVTKSIKGFSIGKKIIRYLISSILITFTATLSISIITCCVFGEYAILTPLANIVVIPFAYLILVFSLIYLVVGAIPVINVLIGKTVKLLANTLLEIIDRLANIRGGVISVDYWFVKLIIIIVFAVLIACLFINIKRKSKLLLVPITAVLMIISSVAVYQYVNHLNINVTYLKNNKSEELVLTSKNKAVICDFSDGSSTNYNMAYDTVRENHVSEIEVLILSHYHERHKMSFKRINEKTTVRNLWLPEPVNEKEYYIMLSLIEVAEKERVYVTIYKGEDELYIFNDVKIECFNHLYLKRSTHPVVMMRIVKNEKSISYIGASIQESNLHDLAESNINLSDYIIFGIHGPVIKTEIDYIFKDNRFKDILAADCEIVQAFDFSEDNYKYLSDRARVIVSAEKYEIVIK